MMHGQTHIKFKNRGKYYSWGSYSGKTIFYFYILEFLNFTPVRKKRKKKNVFATLFQREDLHQTAEFPMMTAA
jgi:hypothetical protein